MEKIILQSDRLVFEKFAEGDYPLFHQLSSDARVMQYITGYPLSKAETSAKFAKILKINKTDEPPAVFKVLAVGSRAFVGLAKATTFIEKEIEIGYVLLPEFWGNGFGSEISVKMMDYGRKIAGTQKLVAVINPANKASKRILEKSGFAYFNDKPLDGLPGDVYKLPV